MLQNSGAGHALLQSTCSCPAAWQRLPAPARTQALAALRQGAVPGRQELPCMQMQHKHRPIQAQHAQPELAGREPQPEGGSPAERTQAPPPPPLLMRSRRFLGTGADGPKLL